ncbi:hypothetical protein OSG_eHP25_00140 [environmental Halophage eHP-25]|nr:hypothetical protein OSG_eHP25_00140 [environmental Halophage eHP-25]
MGIIPEIISAVFGGGVFVGLAKLYRTYSSQSRKDTKSNTEIGKGLRDELRNEVEQERKSRKNLEERVDELEDRIDKEREKRLEAQRKANQLEKKLRVIFSLFNDQRESNGKDRLTLPQITLMALDENFKEQEQEQ